MKKKRDLLDWAVKSATRKTPVRGDHPRVLIRELPEDEQATMHHIIDAGNYQEPLSPCELIPAPVDRVALCERPFDCGNCTYFQNAYPIRCRF